MSDWKTTFDGLVQAMRNLVAQIDELPPDHVDERLAQLRKGMRVVLENYDKAEKEAK